MKVKNQNYFRKPYKCEKFIMMIESYDSFQQDQKKSYTYF